MTVSRLAHIPGIGVNVMGDRADAAADPTMLRMENLDTDLRPPAVALEHTRRAVEDDEANSYLPFEGHLDLRTAAAGLVSRLSGREYDPARECVSVAGGLNGILNALLAITEPGDEVVLSDPIYAGLVNRIRLAGAVPVHVPAVPTPQGWRTDPDELAAAVGPRTAAVLLMGPSMPTGAVFDRSHLDALAGPVREHGAWILYDAAMERIRFDDRPPVHPASHPGPGRTRHHRRLGVQGAADDRLAGRVGRRARRHPRRHRPGGHDQRGLPGRARPGRGRRRPRPRPTRRPTSPQPRAPGATAARSSSQQLADYPVVPPHGGWSLLVDTTQLGLTPAEASQRLFERGRVAATPMGGWGPSGDRYLRLVFANEPVERLHDLRERFAAALLTTDVGSAKSPEADVRVTYPARARRATEGCCG